MKKMKIKTSTLLIILVTLIFVLVIPNVTKGYSMMIVNLGLIYAIAALGVSVMLGMGGQLVFSAVAFMGVGAYLTGNLNSGRLGVTLSTPIVFLIVIVAAAILAYVLGIVLFRLKGTYFTFATIGLVQVAWSFYLNYKPLFGGPDGVSNIANLNILGFSPENYTQWFYILVIFVIVIAFLVEKVRSSQLGRSLAAIRDNEIAAFTLGINVYKTKIIAFTIAGVLAAVAGSLYAMHSRFVSSDMFTFERATSYIIMAMLGGVNNTFGVVIGSLLVTALPEWLRGLQRYLQLIYGIGVVLLMVFMPMGLAGVASNISKDIKRKLQNKKQPAELKVKEDI